MPHKVEEVMTRDPVTLPEEASVVKAAKLMRDRGIGDVLVIGDGRLCGLVTDRDIVVRAVAEGRDLATTPLATLCTCDVVTVGPDQDVAEAARLMREKDVHQLPVVVDGRPVGVVALADLTRDLTPGHAADLTPDITIGGLDPEHTSGHAPAPA
ncbi:CBS domain-containing protein [Microbispora sp. NBRC 16548]|uniref:CBS domain-containing protein n=1 Tax=Microbispora sp. NBRC 16548 TaxID=3030994 RepID=UPI00161C24F8|nr:CBS domain-containing protein [Microbispora sp. NBRC 16548]GLX07192.1 CBS domain-containing protein [Microbispora sp. NBRC 16548]